MRLLLRTVLGIGVLTASSSPPLAQQCEQSPPGLVSWWRAENNANDAIGGNNGTFHHVFISSGEVGEAFLFAFSDSYVGMNRVVLGTTGPFSIDAWVYLVGSATGDYRGIVGEIGSGQAEGHYQLRLQPNNHIAFFRRTGVGNGVTLWETFEPVPSDVWTHVAVVYAGGTNLKIFINGVEALVSTSSDTYAGVLPAETVIGAGESGARFSFLGKIDEVELFSRALTSCEIAAIFQAGAAGRCVGDTDADGIVDYRDNCFDVPNPGQQDTDSDGAGDACDCAPNDPTLITPGEDSSLMLGANGVKANLEWCTDLSTSTVHDVVRGALSALPVGSGGSETCLAPGNFPGQTASDPTTPSVGQGSWYLVRGRNGCGTGTYGFRSNGAERVTATCP